VSSNFRNWLQDSFQGSVQERELRDTTELYARVVSARNDSPLGNDDQIGNFLLDCIADICERRGVMPSDPLADALWSAIRGLLDLEGFIVFLPEESSLAHLTLTEGAELRTTLNRHLRFLADQKRLLHLWREHIVSLFATVLEYFPASAFTDIDEQGALRNDSVVLPEARSYDLCDNVPEALERTILSFWDDDLIHANLCEALRERLDHNGWVLSGAPKRNASAAHKVVLPTENKNKSPDFLVDAYLGGTPLWEFFQSPLPFAIPFPARFEHTHIVGGSGHGKTQLIQFLINHDLVRAQEDGRSVVVIDSQGDLIRTISQLAYFSPSAEKSLADRFVLVDPNDVEHPVCLNMFDFNRDRLSGYAPVDREKILNATIELYEYFFGALLGAELTQRQGLIFKYLARLMMEIPDATIHTLRELMEDSERFRPYMQKLTGTARSFFETRFFDRQFNETKKQILTRLWGVLSNASLERMFSHPRNSIDLFELLNDGKIILINTAKDLLGHEGSAIFGRFFVALIAQAAVQRAAIPAFERVPGFVYIDEAQDYFDESISHLLNQARKYRIGLILAHQNLDQLGAGLRSSVLASTSIKFAGGVSAKDANVLDSEFRCSADFLLSQKKEGKHTEFACHVKNYTSKALSVTVPLGFVESLPTVDTSEQEALLEANRERYSAPPMPPPYSSEAHSTTGPETEKQAAPTTEPEAPVTSRPARSILEPVHVTAPVARKLTVANVKAKKVPRGVADSGRGGQQHKYLQHLIKQLAEERGFRASIEESILEGAGRVDVALVRGEQRIAFEISVTTNRDHELGNVEKCLAAGYADIVVIGGNERHVNALSTFIEENLEEREQGKVRYVAPEGLIQYLDSLGAHLPPAEETVRGYRVRTVQQVVDPKEAGARRKAIAEVIARSLRKSKEV